MFKVEMRYQDCTEYSQPFILYNDAATYMYEILNGPFGKSVMCQIVSADKQMEQEITYNQAKAIVEKFEQERQVLSSRFKNLWIYDWSQIKDGSVYFVTSINDWNGRLSLGKLKDCILSGWQVKRLMPKCYAALEIQLPTHEELKEVLCS